MHLVLTGASGVVGSSVLAHVLSLPAGQVTRLSVLSRKPVAMISDAGNPPNVKYIQHSDFSSYPPELLQDLGGAHGVIWALGVSQNDVSKEEYIKITKDYALAAAKAFSGLNGEKGVNFVYVSGEGATLKPGRFTPIFGRVKGETEQALLEMSKANPALRVYSLRPGGVDPTHQPEVLKVAAARMPGWKYKSGYYALLPALRACYANVVSPTKDLGRVLTQLAMGDGQKLEGKGIEGEGRTIANVGMRRLAGL